MRSGAATDAPCVHCAASNPPTAIRSRTPFLSSKLAAWPAAERLSASDGKRRHRSFTTTSTMSAVKTPSAMSGSILPRVILRSVRLQAALKPPQVFTGRRIAKGLGSFTVAAVASGRRDSPPHQFQQPTRGVHYKRAPDRKGLAEEVGYSRCRQTVGVARRNWNSKVAASPSKRGEIVKVAGEIDPPHRGKVVETDQARSITGSGGGSGLHRVGCRR